ncbi:YitT family protein [Arthrobacter sp. NPDC090010]|uniref:YitT family protein n=1 Tax=Arthrobacter sp. NPDC090010 TaxID=3363942 RepID=UPI0037F6DF2A
MTASTAERFPASSLPNPAPVADRAKPHGLVEDVLGLVTGTFLASLGLYLLHSSGTVTGGTAGLSLLLSYAAGAPFGLMFLLVNAPFFALSAWKKGWNFTLRTIACVTVVSGLSSLHPVALGALHLDPVYGALAGNLLAGTGLLVLFRHRASLGGFNILALLLQERLGWRAGYVQMVLDLLVVLGALTVVAWPLVLLSAAGAVVLNVILAFNHRPGRYTGS